MQAALKCAFPNLSIFILHIYTKRFEKRGDGDWLKNYE
jgi:hypothetical protein